MALLDLKGTRYAVKEIFDYRTLTSNQQSALLADSQMDADLPTQTPNPRKRPAPAPEIENEEDLMDGLLPGVAALKRRKIEQQKEAERTGKSFEEPVAKTQSKEPAPRKKAKKEVNIKDAVRERREAEDQAARENEEDIQGTIGDMNIEEMKRLAVVEEMAVPTRSDRPIRHAANGIHSDRWDDRWNGRKNFKKFRRQGEGGQARRGHTVMVPLEQVKQKDFGIGEEYWLDDSEKAKRKRKTQSQSQAFSSAKSQQIDDENIEPEEPSALEVPAELALNVDDDTPATIDVEAPRTTRRMEQLQDTGQSSNRSQATNGTKRAAPAKAKPPPAKKQKVVAAKDSDDSDSEDGLKFRFRRKK